MRGIALSTALCVHFLRDVADAFSAICYQSAPAPVAISVYEHLLTFL
jgi:hypothetical protein